MCLAKKGFEDDTRKGGVENCKRERGMENGDISISFFSRFVNEICSGDVDICHMIKVRHRFIRIIK